MTAKEMFEELGFIFIAESKRGVSYLQSEKCEIYPYDKNDEIQVTFYKEVECYVCRSMDYEKGDLLIKAELHKAIHQQMKELGWLE